MADAVRVEQATSPAEETLCKFAVGDEETPASDEYSSRVIDLEPHHFKTLENCEQTFSPEGEHQDNKYVESIEVGWNQFVTLKMLLEFKGAETANKFPRKDACQEEPEKEVVWEKPAGVEERKDAAAEEGKENISDKAEDVKEVIAEKADEEESEKDGIGKPQVDSSCDAVPDIAETSAAADEVPSDIKQEIVVDEEVEAEEKAEEEKMEKKKSLIGLCPEEASLDEKDGEQEKVSSDEDVLKLQLTEDVKVRTAVNGQKTTKKGTPSSGLGTSSSTRTKSSGSSKQRGSTKSEGASGGDGRPPGHNSLMRLPSQCEISTCDETEEQTEDEQAQQPIEAYFSAATPGSLSLDENEEPVPDGVVSNLPAFLFQCNRAREKGLPHGSMIVYLGPKAKRKIFLSGQGHYTAEKEYLVIELLGEGRDGSVFRIMDCTSRQEFALKVLSLDNFRDEELRNVIEHPCIVQTLGAVLVVSSDPEGQDRVTVKLIQEFLPGTVTLSKALLDFSWSVPDIIKVFDDLLSAFCVLHGNRISYRDLHGDNVLVSAYFKAFLIDFGRSLKHAVADQEDFANAAAEDINSVCKCVYMLFGVALRQHMAEVDVRDQSELDEQNGLAELLKEGLEEGWKKTSQIENHPLKYPPSAEEMLRRLRQLMQVTNTSLQELASGEREKRVIAPPATQRQPKPKPGPSQGLREEGAEAVGLGAEEGAVGGSLDMSQEGFGRGSLTEEYRSSELASATSVNDQYLQELQMSLEYF